jgi:hypothetical protein
MTHRILGLTVSFIGSSMIGDIKLSMGVMLLIVGFRWYMDAP